MRCRSGPASWRCGWATARYWTPASRTPVFQRRAPILRLAEVLEYRICSLISIECSASLKTIDKGKIISWSKTQAERSDLLNTTNIITSEWGFFGFPVKGSVSQRKFLHLCRSCEAPRCGCWLRLRPPRRGTRARSRGSGPRCASRSRAWASAGTPSPAASNSCCRWAAQQG